MLDSVLSLASELKSCSITYRLVVKVTEMYSVEGKTSEHYRCGIIAEFVENAANNSSKIKRLQKGTDEGKRKSNSCLESLGA